ncbi:hypothetical protein [Lysinibacillus phage vB_LspM-01]|nr:hypothetical protein [Lysinibacillus phage vB_LspM-01]
MTLKKQLKGLIESYGGHMSLEQALEEIESNVCILCCGDGKFREKTMHLQGVVEMTLNYGQENEESVLVDGSLFKKHSQFNNKCSLCNGEGYTDVPYEFVKEEVIVGIKRK